MSRFTYQLDFRICEAKDLKDTQFLGTQDPYAKIYIAGRSKEKVKTRVHENGGRKANWDVGKYAGSNKGHFQCTAGDVVVVEVRNKNVTDTTLIGEARIPVTGPSSAFLDGNVHDNWFNLIKGGSLAGLVRLRFKLSGTGGGPLPGAAPAGGHSYPSPAGAPPAGPAGSAAMAAMGKSMLQAGMAPPAGHQYPPPAAAPAYPPSSMPAYSPPPAAPGYSSPPMAPAYGAPPTAYPASSGPMYPPAPAPAPVYHPPGPAPAHGYPPYSGAPPAAPAYPAAYPAGYPAQGGYPPHGHTHTTVMYTHGKKWKKPKHKYKGFKMGFKGFKGFKMFK